MLSYKDIKLGHLLTDEEYKQVVEFAKDCNVDAITKVRTQCGHLAGLAGLALSIFTATINLPVGIAGIVLFLLLGSIGPIKQTRALLRASKRRLNGDYNGKGLAREENKLNDIRKIILDKYGDKINSEEL